MKKWLKWLLISLVVLLVGLINYIIIKQSLREEADLTFPNTVVVQNATDFEPLDKITKAIVYNVLGYDTINITIAYIPKQLEQMGGKDIRAFIQKNIFQEHAYMVLVSKTFRASEFKMVMSHEMAHLDQYESGDLIQIDLGLEMVIYKGDTIKYVDVPYDNRPHEKDAYKQEDHIYKELEKVLYK